MVRHAESQRKKSLKIFHAKHRKLQDALLEYDEERPKPPDERKSIRMIASKHGISKDTLNRAIKGGISILAFNVMKQKVSPAKERALVDTILASADRGFPLSREQIFRSANALIRNEASDNEPDITVGTNWVSNFLDRHYSELSTHWCSPLSHERAQALNPTAVAAWYDLVKEWCVDKDIPPELIYGMDKSRFPLGGFSKQMVVGRKGTKRQHKQGGGDRENITVIATICADGTRLDPTIIFKGKNFLRKWIEGNVSSASISISSKGWTDSELAVNWMVKDFNRQTHAKAAGRTRVLLMDGHSSHYSPELLRYAQDNNIIILGYPPHCTHALQGLDVVCFARLKTLYNDSVQKFEGSGTRKLTKADFAQVFGHAFLEAMTEESIRAAFEKTGVYPFNPNVIAIEQMKPSEATSYTGGYPSSMSSPVKAIVTAFRSQPRTHFDVAEDTHVPLPVPSPTNVPTHHLDPDTHVVHHIPLSPCSLSSEPRATASLGHRRRRASVEDSPSKRIRILNANLSQTASGSFLVAKNHMRVEDRLTAPVLQKPPSLAEPDWSLLEPADSQSDISAIKSRSTELTKALQLARTHIETRDAALEIANAQLVLQHLHADKLQEALHMKEEGKGKAADRTRLFVDGKGRHLTADEFIEALEKQAELVKDAASALQNRKASRSSKKREKVELERIWQTMLADHNAAVQVWQETCEQLLEGGRKKKDLPPKPKRPRKPKRQPASVSAVNEMDSVAVSSEQNGDEDEDEDDDEDEDEFDEFE